MSLRTLLRRGLVLALLHAGLPLIPGRASEVAAQSATHEVTGDNVRLRRAASTNAEILATLSRGTRVSVLRRSGDWSEVRAGERTGWVSSQFLRALPASTTPEQPPAQRPSGASGGATPPPSRTAPTSARTRASASPPVVVPRIMLQAMGATGGSGYGAGVGGGLTLTTPVAGSSRVHLLLDGAFMQHARTTAGGGPDDVTLRLISGSASLALGLTTGGRVQPYLLAGGGAHYASASTSADVTPNAESTINGAAHAGAGVRVGRVGLEARAVLLQGFTPIVLRVGFGF